jgi:hypothetical protein
MIDPTELLALLSSTGRGGAITSTPVSGTNLLGTFSGQQTTDGATIHKCFYVVNNSAQTAFVAKVFVASETAHETVDAEIGLGASAIGAVEATTADDETAPDGVTFTDADGGANALDIGDLLAGEHKAVWVRLVVPAGTSARDNYTVNVTIDVDSGE